MSRHNKQEGKNQLVHLVGMGCNLIKCILFQLAILNNERNNEQLLGLGLGLTLEELEEITATILCMWEETCNMDHPESMQTNS